MLTEDQQHWLWNHVPLLLLQPESVCILCSHADCRFRCIEELQRRQHSYGGGVNHWMDIAWRELVLFTHVWRLYEDLPSLDMDAGPEEQVLDDIGPAEYNGPWSKTMLFGPLGRRMAEQQATGQPVEIPPGYVRAMSSRGLNVHVNDRRTYYTRADNPTISYSHNHQQDPNAYQPVCTCNPCQDEEHGFEMTYMHEPVRKPYLFTSDEENDDDDTLDGRPPVIVDHPVTPPRIPSPVVHKRSPSDEVRVKLEDVSVGSPLKRQRSDSSSSS